MIISGPRKAKMKVLANLVWRKRGHNDGDDTTMGTKTSDGMLDVKKSSTMKGKRSSETAGKHAGTAATSKKQTRTAKPVPRKLKREYAFIMDGPDDEPNEKPWELNKQSFQMKFMKYSCQEFDSGMEDDNELMEMANGNSKMLQQMYTTERPHWDNSDGAEEENNRGRRDIVNEDSDIEEEQDEGRDRKEDRDDGANGSANGGDGTNGDDANGDDGMGEDHNEEQHDDIDDGAGDGDRGDGDHGSDGGDYFERATHSDEDDGADHGNDESAGSEASIDDVVRNFHGSSKQAEINSMFSATKPVSGRDTYHMQSHTNGARYGAESDGSNNESQVPQPSRGKMRDGTLEKRGGMRGGKTTWQAAPESHRHGQLGNSDPAYTVRSSTTSMNGPRVISHSKGAYKENLQALSKLKLSTNGRGKSANKQQAEDYGQTHFKNEDSSDEGIVVLAPRKQPKAHHLEMKMHSEVENEDDDSDEERDSPFQFQGQCHENDKGWPRETWLAWPTASGRLSMKKQSPIIHKVLTEVVDKVLEYICFEDAFPEMAQCLQFKRTTIAGIAKSLGYNAPEGHICHLCGKVKDVVVNLLFAYYPQQAGKSKEVLALLHGYKYIFPVNENNSIIDDSPYMHPIIAAIIFCQFIKLKLFDITKYTSSIRERADEHEVLAAMVALAAMGVHGALSEWQTRRWQEIFFTKNSYTIDYHKHLASLKAIRKKNKVGYHNLVADIFDAASTCTRKQAINSASEENLILAACLICGILFWLLASDLLLFHLTLYFSSLVAFSFLTALAIPPPLI
ncbi:hypothetical protein EW146_g4768 [Bondarzewia mesenterica]|uniref:DUF6532 domain-containing protein n=1 Tax=Bondarzewia mesenterica TaxID=1095465 RepID=A0A4S4LVN3_9AGAM|nr:hypothetical protein EW146_g4768 [Bondarzewia mesenterica]